MNLNELGKLFYDNAKVHGFWESANSIPEPTLKAEKIALIHSEISEALEAVRKPHESEKCKGYSAEVEEFADAIIRILDYCAHYNLPIHEAVLEKHKYNKTRPYKHGKTI